MTISARLYYIGFILVVISPIGHLFFLALNHATIPHLVSTLFCESLLVAFLLLFHSESKAISSVATRKNIRIFNPALKRFAINKTNLEKEVHSAMSQANELTRNLYRNGGKIGSIENEVSLLCDLIRESKAKSETEIWHSEGLTKLSELLREDTQTLESLSTNALGFCARYTNSKQGLLFLSNEDNTMLDCRASFGSLYKDLASIPVGHGIIGQAFITAEPMYINEVPSTFYKTASGLGSSLPKAAAILPLTNGNECIGILELSAFIDYSEEAKVWLQSSCDAIAAAIRSKLTNEKVKRLLHESEEKTEALSGREIELERIKEQQAEEIGRLNEQHEKNLRLLEEKIQEVEKAKSEVEKIRILEHDRQKKQRETQSKIIQATLDKFRAQEEELQQIIKMKDAALHQMKEEIDSIKSNVKP